MTKRPDISPELRARFEEYPDEVLAHALGAGELSNKGPKLDALVRENHEALAAYLTERRDKQRRHVESHEQLMVKLAWIT